MSFFSKPSSPEGKAAILKRLAKAGHIDCRFGNSGWVYLNLPKPAVKNDVTELLNEQKVQVYLARLMTPEAVKADKEKAA